MLNNDKAFAGSYGASKQIDLNSKLNEKDSKDNKNPFKSGENISKVTLLLDLTYNGDFQLSVDVDTVFGKSAFLSVKILKLTGAARLQFTNVPFKHWSFAFVEVCSEHVISINKAS